MKINYLGNGQWLSLAVAASQAHTWHLQGTSAVRTLEVNFLDTTVFFKTLEKLYKTIQTNIFSNLQIHTLCSMNPVIKTYCTIKSIIKSQIICFYHICSTTSDFHSATSTLFDCLHTRGYSRLFLRTTKNTTLASFTLTDSIHASAIFNPP